MMKRIKNYFKENYKFIMFLIFFCLVMTYKFPYVIYTPGGSINMSERISGDNLYSEEGSLSLTYVSLLRGNLPFILASYIIPNWDLMDEEEVTYKNTSVDDTIKIDKIYLEEAISNALYVAYNASNIPYSITSTKVVVTGIRSDAKNTLKVGDNIISVDGVNISSIEEFNTYINSKKIDDKVIIKYIRDNKTYEDEAALIDVYGSPKIGITLAYISDYKTDYNIKVKTKNSESGPSGGLITALAIYNQITSFDITNGYKIMGTGTISRDGTVGEIGGVKYKLIGAVNKKADIFICPIENYEEALKVKNENNYDITIISAHTFEEIITSLYKLKK